MRTTPAVNRAIRVAWALLTCPALAALPWVLWATWIRADWVSRATGRTEATIVRYAERSRGTLFGAEHCAVMAFTSLAGDAVEVQSNSCQHDPLRPVGERTTVRYVPGEPRLADEEAVLARGAFVWGEFAALTAWVTGVSAIWVSLRRLSPGVRAPVASTGGRVMGRLPFSRVGTPPPAVSVTTVPAIVGSPKAKQEES